MKSFLIRLNRLLTITNKTKVDLIPLVFIFLFSGFLDIIGLGLLYPLAKIVIDPNYSLQINYLQGFFSGFEDYNYKNYLLFFSITLVIIFFLRTAMSIITRLVIMKFAYKQYANLQVRLLKCYQDMKYIDFLNQQSTVYIRNIKDLGKYCIDSLEACLRVISESVVFLIIILYLIFFNPKILLILGSVIFIISYIFVFLLKPISYVYGKRIAEAYKSIYQTIDESIKGLKEIRIISKEKFFLNELDVAATKVYKNTLKESVINFSPRYILELTIIIFIIGLIFFSLGNSGEKSTLLSTISVFAVAGARLLPSSSTIVNNMTILNMSDYAIEVIYADLKKSKQYKENNLLSFKENKNFNEINFNNISFKYPNSENYILKNCQISIKKGDCIGIMGASGSGKTTLINIFLGLLEPTSGEIYLDSLKKKSDHNALSSFSSYMPQDCFILENSIKANICLEDNESKIDNKRINEALKFSYLEKFVSNLPNKSETLIGENGVRISGGEAQRLVMARIYYHNREILIMDEATNALDKKSEDIIIQNLEKLKGKKTIIVVTHEKKILQSFDKVYLLSDGKLHVEKNH